MRWADADSLFVGSPALRGVSLRTGVDTTEVFAVQNGTRRLVSTSVQTITVTDGAYLVAQENRSSRASAVDSIWVEIGTFATRRHVEVTPAGWRRVSFDALDVHGTVKDSSGEHTFDVHRTRALIDNSIVAALADVLPLASGYTATIPSYDVGAGAAGEDRFMTLRVMDAEPVEREAARPVAWKVEMNFTASTQQWSVLRWVDRATRRELQWMLKTGGRELVGVAK